MRAFGCARELSLVLFFGVLGCPPEEQVTAPEQLTDAEPSRAADGGPRGAAGAHTIVETTPVVIDDSIEPEVQPCKNCFVYKSAKRLDGTWVQVAPGLAQVTFNVLTLKLIVDAGQQAGQSFTLSVPTSEYQQDHTMHIGLPVGANPSGWETVHLDETDAAQTPLLWHNLVQLKP